jgi:hypothetical protein
MVNFAAVKSDDGIQAALVMSVVKCPETQDQADAAEPLLP